MAQVQKPTLAVGQAAAFGNVMGGQKPEFLDELGVPP